MTTRLLITLTLVLLLPAQLGVIFSQDTAVAGFGLKDFTHDAETSNVTTHNLRVDENQEGPAIDIDLDDLMVGVWCWDGNTSTEACPSGWDLEFNVTQNSGSPTCICCAKIAVSADTTATSFDATHGGTAQQSEMVLWTFTGYTGTAITALNSDTDVNDLAGTSPVSPAKTSPVSGSLYMKGWGADAGRAVEDSNFATECDGTAEMVRESNDGGSGPASMGACIDGIDATGSITWTGALPESGGDTWVGWVLEVID